MTPKHIKWMTSATSNVGTKSSLYSGFVFNIGLSLLDGAFEGLRRELCLGFGGPLYCMIWRESGI
jgi:hypothetical protein